MGDGRHKVVRHVASKAPLYEISDRIVVMSIFRPFREQSADYTGQEAAE